MIKIITQITAPYFETRLGLWIFRGFSFKNIDGSEFLFLQTLDVFGGHTNWVEIAQRWNLYKVDSNATLECMTLNGIETDASFMKKNDSQDSISRRKGLAAEDIAELEAYAKKESLQKDQVNNSVITEIQPLLEKQALVIEEAMEKLENLEISDLVKIMNEINDLGSKIHKMYPRSNEELLKRALKVREAYAKAKYPELYAELKRVHEDKKYKDSKDDDVVGFSIRSIYQNLFYQYFMKSPAGTWKDRSPFEGQFKKPVLFIELVTV